MKFTQLRGWYFSFFNGSTQENEYYLLAQDYPQLVQNYEFTNQSKIISATEPNSNFNQGLKAKEIVWYLRPTTRQSHEKNNDERNISVKITLQGTDTQAK